MSPEIVQSEGKKFSSVEMVPLEKQNSIEVGEISDISEQDIGEYIWRHIRE